MSKNNILIVLQILIEEKHKRTRKNDLPVFLKIRAFCQAVIAVKH